MTITYKTTEYTEVMHELGIEDDKNIFLLGRNKCDGLNTYLGIWRNKNYLVIATLISGRNISYEYYSMHNISTDKDIEKFMQHTRDVKVIPKDEFETELKRVISILEI